MSDFVIAVIGGVAGTVLTALLAFGARITRLGSEVKANDRALRLLDQHLETWVADETIYLVRRLKAIREELNSAGLTHSGEYGRRIGWEKEAALQRYRDQERTAQAQADEIRAREGRMHGLVRAWRLPSLDLDLRAPDRVLPVLDQWALPPKKHLSPADPVPDELDSDPRQRTVDSAISYLEKRPGALE